MDGRGGSLLGKRAAPENAEGGSGTASPQPDPLGFSQPVGAQDIGGLPPHSGLTAYQQPSSRAKV
jgi:hypothetical protein